MIVVQMETIEKSKTTNTNKNKKTKKWLGKYAKVLLLEQVGRKRK